MYCLARHILKDVAYESDCAKLWLCCNRDRCLVDARKQHDYMLLHVEACVVLPFLQQVLAASGADSGNGGMLRASRGAACGTCAE